MKYENEIQYETVRLHIKKLHTFCVYFHVTYGINTVKSQKNQEREDQMFELWYIKYEAVGLDLCHVITYIVCTCLIDVATFCSFLGEKYFHRTLI